MVHFKHHGQQSLLTAKTRNKTWMHGLNSILIHMLYLPLMCKSVTCLSIALLQASKAVGHLQKAWLPHPQADGNLLTAWLPQQKASMGPLVRKVKGLCNTFVGSWKHLRYLCARLSSAVQSAEQRSPVSSSQPACFGFQCRVWLLYDGTQHLELALLQLHDLLFYSACKISTITSSNLVEKEKRLNLLASN